MAYGIETRCIHGEDGITREHAYGSMGTPIYQTATFAHPGVGQSTGFDYTRESNPTRSELERIVSSLEKAYDTVACASGMAALSILLELFENGAHFCMLRGFVWRFCPDLQYHWSKQRPDIFLCQHGRCRTGGESH